MPPIGYEWVLVHHGLSKYIEHAPRNSLFSQNREGILSLPGYAATYLLARGIARALITGLKRPRFRQAAGMAVAAAILAIGSYAAGDILGLQQSRRMANLRFVLDVAALACSVLAYTMAASASGLLLKCPPIFAAFSRHSLHAFLVANLLTGAVNLTIDTLALADVQLTAAILIAYVLAVFLSVWLICDRRHKTT